MIVPEAFLQYGANLTDEEISQKIEERNQARNNKDFLKADQIRDELASQGILLDDSSDGTSWKKS
jgi:cysteinyl-tRNA synthetase